MSFNCKNRKGRQAVCSSKIAFCTFIVHDQILPLYHIFMNGFILVIFTGEHCKDVQNI